MTTLRVRVNKNLEGSQAFALGKIISAKGKLVFRAPVPVGHDKFLSIQLTPGRYLVRASMPSGLVLSKTVSLTDAAMDVVLEAAHSEREWLSWSNFVSGAAGEGSIPKRGGLFARNERADINAREIRLRIGSQEFPVSARSCTLSFGDTKLKLKVTAKAEGPFVVIRFSCVGDHGDPRKWVRLWVSAKMGPHRRAIASVPAPWLSGRTSRDVEVLLREKNEVNAREPLAQDSMSIVVRDPIFGGVFGFLALGNPTDALKAGGDLYDHARALLRQKTKNPYAAAAAAYLLVMSTADNRRREPSDWPAWLANLSRWFGWLPDGAVLHGWHMLQQRRHRAEARTLLLEAVSRGIPVYTQGIRLLIDGLSILQSKTDEDVDQALKIARRYGSLVDPHEPFSVATDIGTDQTP